MYIQSFTYHKPATLLEACKLLESQKNAAAIAGGTDILVEIKKGLRHNDNIVSLSGIKELKILEETNNQLLIGAAVTHNEIKKSKFIKGKFPALAEAASQIGTDQVRNTATVGGNLCTGASCCDMAPVLIASNASAEIVSTNGKRIVSLKDFFVFHKETSIRKGELMTKIIVPLSEPGTGVCFKKFGLRDASSISVASASAFIKVEDDVCVDSRIVIGAVAPIPKISEKASEVLNGAKIIELSEGSSVLKEVGEAAASDSFPLDDIRGTADFRRDIVNILVQRAVLKAAKRAINLIIR
ncbi:MAG: xanthine dehydrogenase family protein subunit M [Ignavibacteriaceae bacterium]